MRKSLLIMGLFLIIKLDGIAQDKNSLMNAKEAFDSASKNSGNVDSAKLIKAKFFIDEAWRIEKYRKRADAMMLRGAIYSSRGRLQSYDSSLVSGKEAKILFERSLITKGVVIDHYHTAITKLNLQVLYQKAGSVMMDKNYFLRAYNHFKDALAIDKTEAGGICF